MGKLWALFFAAAISAAIGVSIYAPYAGWWLPGPSVSPLGRSIDDLYYMILVITTITFVGTEIVLVYILWTFGQSRERRSTFTHGSHMLEVVWTVVPAGILLFISLYQIDVWMESRNYSRYQKEARELPLAEVTARQFEWRIRYPAPGKKLQPRPQPDDLYTVNDLHVPFDKPVVIHLVSDDVLHSFFLPHLRVKQDAVPGKMIPVAFQAQREGYFDLVCAELCGWGHYKMRGRVTVEQQKEFDAYLRALQKKQFDDGVSGSQSGTDSPPVMARAEE